MSQIILISWIFFHERIEQFVQHWLYKTLGAEWHWYRYEFAVLRSGLHTHGLAKLKSDLGLSALSGKVIEGHKAYLTLTQGNKSTTYQNDQKKDDFSNLMNTINEGKMVEKKICEYYEHLISFNNPGQVEESVKPTKHPCRNDFKTAVSDLDSDYVDLVNSVQRHSK